MTRTHHGLLLAAIILALACLAAALAPEDPLIPTRALFTPPWAP